MKTLTSVLIVLISLIVSTKVFSSTIKVTTGSDNVAGCLRDAISNSQNGDSITFETSLTEIVLTSQITIDKSITIIGNPRLEIYSSLNMPRVFVITQTSNTITVNISNLLFRVLSFDFVTTKMDGGAILVDNSNSNVNINYCFFTYNPGGGYGDYQQKHGGGIALYNGNLKISNCTFSSLCTSSVSGSAGGAIFQISGTLALTNCTFCGNTAALGSAIYTRNSILNIINCTFADNDHYDYLSTTARNSTIYNYLSQVSVKNSVFKNNDYEIVGAITSGGYNVFPEYTTALIQCTINGDNTTNILNTYNFNYNTNGSVVFAENDFWIKTCALISTSVCINALPGDGNGAPVLDQRGFIWLNNSDIGAFEYGGSAPILNVSTNTLTIAALANSTKTFNITSNTPWTATSSQTWLTLSSASGSNNATMTLTAASNPTIATRTATVTVSGTGVSVQTVAITQDGSTTGVDEIENSKISIFPNPANTTLFVNGLTQNSIILIFDLSGVMRIKQQTSNNIIDISNLTDGIYIVEIIEKFGITTRKLIKQ